jgi:glutathione synthase/RimK-type ligase-like ATP-grasp enzyme
VSTGARAPLILLLTHRGDFYTIDRVAAAVERRGATAIRVDTDAFPAELALAVRMRDGQLSGRLVQGGVTLELADVGAVWMRRLWPSTLTAELDPRWAAISHHQSHVALTQLLPLLDHAAWLDPLDRQLAAEAKPRQLREAARVGLRTPETLFSNDPQAVRAFAAERAEPVITKLLAPIAYDMQGGRGDFMYTSRLSREDLEALDGLRWVPQIFQPEIPKGQELRVVLVGERVFAGAIDTRGSARGEVDWRKLRAGEGPAWQPATLPDEIAAKARALLDRFGLGFGALDLIVTPAGEHVFLELNPAGEWGWLERDLGLPISEAIAEHLVAGAGVTTQVATTKVAIAQVATTKVAAATPIAAAIASPTPPVTAPAVMRRPGGRPTVLVVTHSGDNECIGMVSAAIEARGGIAVRLDTDRYPSELGLSTRQAHASTGRLLTAAHDVALEELHAVWYRRFAAGGRLPGSLGDTRDAAVGEARRVLHGTIANLACFQLDPLAAVQRAHHKDLQLRLAAEVGLEVPRTLVTNRAEDAIALWHQLDGRMVTKMQHSFAIYREGRENVVFTTRVREPDLAELDGLRWCPMTFQEELPKQLELRVTVVGRRVMAASIDSARRDHTAVDWRRDGLGLLAEWEPFALPEAIATRLLALQQRLGLEYGAADFVLTPEGRFVFLEVNPVGEFFWLDHLAQPAISDSIAALLLGQAERNVDRDGG